MKNLLIEDAMKIAGLKWCIGFKHSVDHCNKELTSSKHIGLIGSQSAVGKDKVIDLIEKTLIELGLSVPSQTVADYVPLVYRQRTAARGIAEKLQSTAEYQLSNDPDRMNLLASVNIELAKAGFHELEYF